MEQLSPTISSKRYRHPSLGLQVLLRMLRSLVRGTLHRYPLADSAGAVARNPLLIISAGRSGTTLLRSMLVAGGQIAIPPETQILHTIIVKYIANQGLGWEDLSRLIISSFESHHLYYQWNTNLYPAYEQALKLPDKERSLARLVDIVYRMYADKNFPEALSWGDQSPLHTFFLSWIQPVFPGARYLHLLRDGRDVISSMVERQGAGYLEHAVFRWMRSIECVDRLRKRTNHDQLLEIRYEDLVTSAPDTLQMVSDFAGISFSEKMLKYWELPTTVENKYHTYHRNLDKPVFASSVGKWQERLTQEQQHYVMNRISPLLERLGYPL